MLMMTKTFCLYERFFVSNRNFTTEHVKTVNIPGSSRFFVQNSRFFSKFLEFQVFFLPKLSNSRFFQVKWQPCEGLLNNLLRKFDLKKNRTYAWQKQKIVFNLQLVWFEINSTLLNNDTKVTQKTHYVNKHI